MVPVDPPDDETPLELVELLAADDGLAPEELSDEETPIDLELDVGPLETVGDDSLLDEGLDRDAPPKLDEELSEPHALRANARTMKE